MEGGVENSRRASAFRYDACRKLCRTGLCATGPAKQPVQQSLGPAATPYTTTQLRQGPEDFRTLRRTSTRPPASLRPEFCLRGHQRGAESTLLGREPDIEGSPINLRSCIKACIE